MIYIHINELSNRIKSKLYHFSYVHKRWIFYYCIEMIKSVYEDTEQTIDTSLCWLNLGNAEVAYN